MTRFARPSPSFRRAVSAGLAALALALCGARSAAAAPPIWHIRSGQADITLFGSVHLLSAATEWKTPALRQAVATADQIWFEIPITGQSQADARAEALQLGLLPAGQTLAALIPPELDARVGALARLDGLQPALVERLRPWMAELTLSTAYFEKNHADASLGVEEQIAAMAPTGAAREAFETVSEQIHLFADDPLADQVASLRQTLDEIADDPGLFGRIAGEWAGGDTKALVREVILPMQHDTPGDYQRLLVDRNRRFAQRIEAMLGGSQHVLVVVGVGHLIGPQGVPALLRRDGVTVEGP